VQYVRETFQYLKRVWRPLSLICLPAAVMLGFFIRPVSGITYLPFYAGSNISRGFAEIFLLVVGDITVRAVVPPLLFFVVLLLTFCFVCSFIEKHFRIGRTLFKKSFSEINNFFIPTLKVFLILAGLLLIYFALLVSGATLQHYLFSGGGNPNVASVIVASVWSLILAVLLMWLCSPLIFMIPLLQIYGYSFGDAFRASLSYYGNSPLKITFGLAFGFIAAAAVALPVAMLALYIPDWVQVMVWAILHWFLLVYVGAYSMVTTFSVTGMERKDKKKYY